MTCRKICCRFKITRQTHIVGEGTKWTKKQTKNKRKQKWNKKQNCGIERDCLTLVAVCNCHLIAIEILCLVVSNKRCAGADINISSHQSICRIFIHIVDFREFFPLHKAVVFRQPHTFPLPHRPKTQIQSIRIKTEWATQTIELICLAEIFTHVFLQWQCRKMVCISFTQNHDKNEYAKTLMMCICAIYCFMNHRLGHIVPLFNIQLSVDEANRKDTKPIVHRHRHKKISDHLFAHHH